MDIRRFWALIEDARDQVSDADDGDAVADRASALLAALPREEIVAAQRILGEVMAASYRAPLWAAAYLVNGGCSDDGFDYFRGWLLTQGRAAFERAVDDPDTLADLTAIRSAVGEAGVECETAFGIAADAHRAATGEDLPAGALHVRLPELDPEGDFDLDDDTEMRRRLPRLAALCLD